MIFILILIAIVMVVLCLTQPNEAYTESIKVQDSLCKTSGQITPSNEKQFAFLKRARQLVKEALDHLETQTQSQNAKEILNWMTNENVFLIKGKVAGRMHRNRKRRRACMFLNPKKITTDGRLQALICHELAHLTGKGHDMKWRDTNKYLLNLTSRDLGWKNELECGSCIKYKICDKKMCPRCSWTEGDHTTCRPLKKRGTELQKNN